MSLVSNFTRTIIASLLATGALAGCAPSSQRPVSFAGGWAKICNHPSMTDAAYREARACHRSAHRSLAANK